MEAAGVSGAGGGLAADSKTSGSITLMAKGRRRAFTVSMELLLGLPGCWFPVAPSNRFI